MPSVKKNKPLKKNFKKQSQNVTEEPDVADVVVSGQLQKKIIKQKQKKDAKIAKQRGVVFIKHLPHGFFEEQLKNYFEQFGAVTRLRLCRSRRTGGSKGYAFVEFQYPEVAQVATQTMNNYLMFKKVVKAAYIPPEKQIYNFFKSNVRKVKNKAGKSIYVSWKTAAAQRKVNQHNDWSDDVYQKRTIANMAKINKLNKKFQNSNIDFTKLALIPKTVTNEETPTNTNIDDTENQTETDGSLKKKRKTAKAADQQTKAKKQKNETQNKKEIELEDLLGRTIGEDDEEEDEDYVAGTNSNDEENYNDDEEFESTDEETYSFLKDSQEEDDEDEDDEDENGEDEEENEDEVEEENDSKVKLIKKKPTVLVSAKSTKKPLKENTKTLTKLDRLVQLVKHKKGGGGIKKPLKKTTVAKNVKKNKTEKKKNMQLELAKTVAKPLSSIKMGKKNKNNKLNKNKI